jgi:hypothetical protein
MFLQANTLFHPTACCIASKPAQHSSITAINQALISSQIMASQKQRCNVKVATATARAAS